MTPLEQAYRAGLEAAARYHDEEADKLLNTGNRSMLPFVDQNREDAAAIRALPVPETDDEALVERMAADTDFQSALAEYREVIVRDRCVRGIRAKIARAALAAMREGK